MIFNVSDVAGNVATTNLTLSVRPLKMAKILSTSKPLNNPGELTDGFVERLVPSWMKRGVRLLVWGILMGLIILNWSAFEGATLGTARAVQLITSPRSLSYDREAFDR